MKKIKIELTNGKLIPSIITNEELIYGVTAIAVGMKNDYIDISRYLGKIENIYAKHPLTNEILPIIVLNNDILEKNSMMLVPAHIQEHFYLAKKFNLPYKQPGRNWETACSHFTGSIKGASTAATPSAPRLSSEHHGYHRPWWHLP